MASERLSVAEREAWSSRLTALYNECGCKAGAAALLGALTLSAVGLRRPQSLKDTAQVGLSAARNAVMASVAGKSIGLASRHARLQHAVTELSTRLSPG